MPEPIAIDYATPAVLPPPREGLFRSGLWLTGIAGGVGVGILLLFVVTEWTPLAFAGLFWFGIGGLMTFAAFVNGATYAVTAAVRRFPPPASRGRAVMAVLLPVALVPLAFACASLGTRYAEQVARTVYITNVGSTPIDGIDLLDSTGGRPLGSLAAGERLRAIAKRGDDFIAIRIRRGDRVTEHVVDEYFIAFPGTDARHVAIDAAGVVTLREHGRPIVLPPTTVPTSQPVPSR